MIFLGDAAGREAEDAAMPVVAGEDEDAFVDADLLLGLFTHTQFDGLALRIHSIELRAQFPRGVVIGRGEEIDRSVC